MRETAHMLEEILSVLSRICVMLEHFGPWRHPEAQKRLCDGLFGPKSGQVWNAVLKWIRKHKEEEGFEVTPTLFHEQPRTAVYLPDPHKPQ